MRRMRRRVHWVRDERGRFAISLQPAEQPAEQSDRPNADAGARSSRTLAEPPNMTDWVRAKVYGGSPEAWARERLSQE
jgi:hypothetical protein